MLDAHLKPLQLVGPTFSACPPELLSERCHIVKGSIELRLKLLCSGSLRVRSTSRLACLWAATGS